MPGIPLAGRTPPPNAAALVRRPHGVEANATLVDRHDLTDTIVRLRIRPDAVVRVRAGQYCAIGLLVADRFVQRPYSVASPPTGTRDLEFLVRLVPGGTLTPHLWQLHPGDRLRVGPARGLFALDGGDRRQHLLLSTGTGIAPLRSMLVLLLADRGPRAGGSLPRPPVVVHGTSTAPELAYRDELARLGRTGAIVYLPAVSRPTDPANAGWDGLTGRLDTLIAAVARASSIDPSSTVAYLCGNPRMIDAVTPRLIELGIPPDAIRAEQYWTVPR